jgi:hypothetical protein
MANYYCWTRTNYFKVKKLNDFRAKLGSYSGGEGGIDIWEENGLVALGAYGSMITLYDEDKDDWIEIFEVLQDHIEDDEVVIIAEAGHEKLRYVTTFAWLVTKDDVRFVDAVNEVVKDAMRITGKSASDLLPQY